MARTRKITMTVFCLTEDAEEVAKSLFDQENAEGWFFDSDYPLANLTVRVQEPTSEEDAKAQECLDESDTDSGSEGDRSIAEAGVQHTTNQIFVIHPYRWHGQFVFDDEARGLDREPFVAGVPKMLELAAAQAGIENPEDGFVLLFSDQPFPGANICLDWQRKEMGGNVYAWNGMEGWLCPALERFYPPAVPQHLYVQLQPAKG